MKRRHLAVPAAALSCAALVAGVLAGGSGAAPSQSQAFFRTQLLASKDVSKDVKKLLDSGGNGMIDKSVAFKDLTGDKKTDAIVRVLSNAASGAVAVYIFTTDGKQSANGQLQLAYAQEGLLRASTKISDTSLLVRTSHYTAGDELCCPKTLTETTVDWNKSKKAFEVTDENDVAGPKAPSSATATPTPSGSTGPTGPKATPTATPKPKATATATPKPK